MDVASELLRAALNAAVSAQSTATSRSSRVGVVRAAISGVNSWKGSARVISAADPTTAATLPRPRMAARTTRKVELTTRPIPRLMIGPISGETSMAPITTAVLLRTRPSVAMPIASRSWSQ